MMMMTTTTILIMASVNALKENVHLCSYLRLETQ